MNPGVERGGLATDTEARAWLAEHFGCRPEHLNMPMGHATELMETIQRTQGKLRTFFLLAVQHRPRKPAMASRAAPLMVWWAPKDSGYANSLFWAGRYTAEQLVKNTEYYRLWPRADARTMAVPCEAVLKIAFAKPDLADKGFWCDGPGPILPNHLLVWDLLEKMAVNEAGMLDIFDEETKR